MPHMSDAPDRILVVDDEQAITDLVAMALKYEGFTVQTAATARADRQAVLDFRPALIILDVGLPEQHGFSFTQKLISHGLKVPVLFLTPRPAPRGGRGQRPPGARRPRAQRRHPRGAARRPLGGADPHRVPPAPLPAH